MIAKGVESRSRRIEHLLLHIVRCRGHDLPESLKRREIRHMKQMQRHGGFQAHQGGALDGMLGRCREVGSGHNRIKWRHRFSLVGTSLNYHIEVTPERWLPSSFGTSFMRHELAEQFTALAREMERRHKSRQTP